MTKEFITHVPVSLIERFRQSENETHEEIAKREWRSIACMSCGNCCCSPVVPISGPDFEAFFERLNLNIDRDDFAEKFIADTDTNAPNYTIETEKYGGRCLFLAKWDCFQCAVWDVRPDVCSGFSCWELTKFAKMEAGEEQDSFDPAADWMENFAILVVKLRTESPLSFFADDMRRYAALLTDEDAPSWFETHYGEFTDRS